MKIMMGKYDGGQKPWWAKIMVGKNHGGKKIMVGKYRCR